MGTVNRFTLNCQFSPTYGVTKCIMFLHCFFWFGANSLQFRESKAYKKGVRGKMYCFVFFCLCIREVGWFGERTIIVWKENETFFGVNCVKGVSFGVAICNLKREPKDFKFGAKQKTLQFIKKLLCTFVHVVLLFEILFFF